MTPLKLIGIVCASVNLGVWLFLLALASHSEAAAGGPYTAVLFVFAANAALCWYWIASGES